MAETTRALRREREPVAAPRVAPPEPEGIEPFVTQRPASGVELDGATRYPDLFGSPVEEEPSRSPSRRSRWPRSRPAELEPAAEEPGFPPLPGGEDARAQRDRVARPVGHAAQALHRGAGAPRHRGQDQTSARLVEALSHFGVEAKVIGTVAGPHITRYELRLAPGVKMSKVAQLKDDLAYALAATEIRILAPIPGKTAVGVEVPNARRKIVQLGDVFADAPRDWSPLTVWLGKDVSGKAIGADLAQDAAPARRGHDRRRQVRLRSTRCSRAILLRATPDEVRLVLVDPKQVELNHYEAIPHLLTPVITSPRTAANALQNLVREMEWRYGVMSMARTRSLPELNAHRLETDDEPLPYILCVIDELADLMMVAPADVEDSIIRLAQKARAVGIHLVLATQSPRVDVITGMIKANVPSRIAFAVSSQTDSRVILDQNGAESLLGQGDMLFSPVGSLAPAAHPGRVHRRAADRGADGVLGASRASPSCARTCSRRSSRRSPKDTGDDDGFDPDEDPLLGDAIQLVVEMGTASTSMLQRRLRLGYTRAGRLIDMLERRGVISGYEGSKPRQVLVTEGDLPRVLADAGRADDRRRRRGHARRARARARRARRRIASAANAGDRGNAARGADARADRHLGDRGRDEDPREVPARARERGMGPPARADLRQDLPAHLRGRAGARRAAAGRGVQAAPRAPLGERAAADLAAHRAARAEQAPGPAAASGAAGWSAAWWPRSSRCCTSSERQLRRRRADGRDDADDHDAAGDVGRGRAAQDAGGRPAQAPA